MADIAKSKNHTMDVDSVKERVEKAAGDIAKKMGIKYTWNGNVCDLSGSGIKSGKIAVTETTVSIELNLGMMAKMMKPVIEKEIESKIAEIVR
jgi:putative polyhydroxyalkanoate system protein